MRKDQILFIILGIFIGGILTWSVLSQGGVKSPTMMGRIDSVENSDTIDAHFIEQMIPHHEDAIRMGKMALEKATHEELETLARSIIDSQGREIDQMKIWYSEWFGRELPTGAQVMRQHGMMGNSGMHMGMMGDATDMEKLENASDFDLEFIREMIPHHQMAVMMASMLRNGTTRPEMKKLADDIITAQTSEIEQMRKWYKEWSD